jgi:3',5'-cyclic AMP phosphodiesterase CpdA
MPRSVASLVLVWLLTWSAPACVGLGAQPELGSVSQQSSSPQPGAAQQPAAPAPSSTPSTASSPAVPLKLPNKPDSVRFAVIGDNGTGERAQYEVGDRLFQYYKSFPFEMVIMLGDNLYGRQEPADFVAKFEKPYQALLDANVKFYAALGNHDNQENRFYAPWNMGGERFYSFEKKNAKFFVLDTDYLDPKQQAWIERELKASGSDWKIVYFHHPLYSSGGRHGSEVDLRVVLEPMFVNYGVNVVFSGHDHIYERIKPQKGIYYFVQGSSGQLRPGDLKRSALTEAGYDQDQSFMLVEIDKDEMYFQTVTRAGRTIDSGVIRRQKAPTGADVELKREDIKK